MINLLIAILMVVVVALLLRAGLLLVRLYTMKYELYRLRADAFYEAADRLVSNPNTPDDVVAFVGEMNQTINFPHSAMFFVHVLQKARRRRAKGEITAPRFDIRAMPQDVVADFVLAVENWIEAMAARSMFWGRVFKAYLDGPTIEARAKAVAIRSRHHTEAVLAA